MGGVPWEPQERGSIVTAERPSSRKTPVDFRSAVHPSRAWILGLTDPTRARIELLASDEDEVPGTTPARRQPRPSPRPPR
jgi:hypothetical protein